MQALVGVDFEVDAGEVHALLGENGAGKSTLMKVIAGSVKPDSGSMALGGERIEFGSPEEARSRGIAIVYQELSLVPSLSVAENVVLGRWPRRAGVVDWRAVEHFAEAALARVGFRGDSGRSVTRLGMAERQVVELAKALGHDARVLLLDEPTSALSDPEARRLFEVIRDVTGSGVAVVYVSHRLGEVLEIADRVTVLRDGRLIDTVAARSVNEATLARMMVGRAFAEQLEGGSAGRERPRGEVVLRTRALGRLPRLKPIDLELRAGEIVAVFGLVGAGRTRLARTLFGLEPATEGAVEVGGRDVVLDSPAKAIDRGIGYVGEDRSSGIIPRMSIAANITLASLDNVARLGVIDFDQEREVARGLVKELGIRTSSIDGRIGTLSGGNQQKSVLARWLCTDARVLLLDDATRGIDVGAKEEVFKLARRLADDGVAILYFTSELKEARALADRVLVMAGGEIVSETGPQTPEDELMTAAGGVRV